MNKLMALVHLVQPRISAFRLGRPLRPTSSHALAQFAAKPHMAIELLSVEPLEITASCAKCMQNCLLEFENILKLTRRDSSYLQSLSSQRAPATRITGKARAAPMELRAIVFKCHAALGP